MKLFASVLALTLGTAALANPAYAAPHKVDCLISVEGKTYVDGPCDYDDYGDGSFQLGDYKVTHQGVDSAHTRGKGTFVQVEPTGQSTWNDGGSLHAQDPIGDGILHHVGACWQNASAKICSWKLGEPRHFAEDKPSKPVATLTPAPATDTASTTASDKEDTKTVFIGLGALQAGQAACTEQSAIFAKAIKAVRDNSPNLASLQNDPTKQDEIGSWLLPGQTNFNNGTAKFGLDKNCALATSFASGVGSGLSK